MTQSFTLSSCQHCVQIAGRTKCGFYLWHWCIYRIVSGVAYLDIRIHAITKRTKWSQIPRSLKLRIQLRQRYVRALLQEVREYYNCDEKVEMNSGFLLMRRGVGFFACLQSTHMICPQCIYTHLFTLLRPLSFCKHLLPFQVIYVNFIASF